MKKILKVLMTGAVLGAVSISCLSTAYSQTDAVGESQSSNKYNVVFVTDESGSMKRTDAGQLRYDATDLFLGLMTQGGNYVGAISFDDEVVEAQTLKAVSSQEDKDAVSAAIKSHTATNGDTDIGGALQQAVTMLSENANSELPSVIILLTDGNTDLDNDPSVVSDEEEASLEAKAEAIEAARNAGYQIYSICLNENDEADFSETQQISDATGGQAQEVTNASDLMNVYEMFYQMIYGTTGEYIYEGVVPVDASFEVPAAGVEEANIIIEGNVTSVSYTDPSGNPYTDVQTTQTGSLILGKILSPVGGTWRVSVDGDPNATIRISLLINYNFNVTDTSVFEDAYMLGDEVEITAELTNEDGSKIVLADDEEYSAEVRIIDQSDNVIDTVEMDVSEDGGFSASYEVDENDHAYRYYIAAMREADDSDGNIVKRTDTNQFVSGSNTAPVSNGDVSKTVKLWPFKKNVLELDLTSLATDAEDSELTYTVQSSSFRDKAKYDDGDYSISGSTLTQDSFSLLKGSYTIRCTDSGGMYCDVNVTVKTIPIGLLTMIGIILVIVIVVAILLFGIYVATRIPFYGDCFMRKYYNDQEEKRIKARGRIALSAFNIPIRGINAKKSYLQAMRGEGVTLVTDREVMVNGRPGKEHVIASGITPTPVMTAGSTEPEFFVRFESKAVGGRRRSGRTSRTGRSRGADRGAGRTAGRTSRDSGRSTGRTAGRTPRDSGRSTGRSTGRGPSTRRTRN